MNRGEARPRTRLYLNERTPAQWTEAELDGFLLEAEREVYEEVLSCRSDLMSKVARFTWAVDALSIDLSAQLDSAGVALGDYWAVTGMFTLGKDAAPGRANMPLPFYSAQSLFDLFIDTPQGRLSGSQTRDEQWLEHAGSLFDSGVTSSITEAHELVPMLATVKALASVRDAPGPMAIIYTRRLKSFIKLIGTRANKTEPRRVGR